MAELDKIKVCVIGLRGFPGVQGGVEKHCEALYPRMHRIDFTVYRRKPYLPTDAPKEWHGICFIDLPSTRIKGLEALYHTFISSLSVIKRRPDVVHVHNIGPALFAPLLKLFGLKVVTTYHSANYEHKKWGAFARSVLRFGEKMAMRYSDRLIYVNEAKYLALPDEIKRKASLIPNGVNKVSPSTETDYIASLGLRPGEYLLGVGRLTPEKGFEYLVEAANLNPHVKHVVIAGGADHDTAYLDRLKSLDKKGKVIFTGNLQGEPLRQLYSHAKGFVLSSVTEGFPLVLLEAMSYHLPVIVSRIPATEPLDFVPSAGFFRSADSEDLCRTMTALMTDPSIPARVDYPLEQYDWQSIADRTEQIFLSCTREGTTIPTK